VSISRTSLALALGLALSGALVGCRSPSLPDPRREDLVETLGAMPQPDLVELGAEAWGIADPSVEAEDDLPSHLWAYDGHSRIYNDRRHRDVFVGYDGDRARWVVLSPSRARLEFRPGRARLVASDAQEPWRSGGGEEP
jgi:hypothetical protein